MVDPGSLKSSDTADANSPAVSEAELTALALQHPAPDDFRGPEASQTNPVSEASGARFFWLVTLLAIGVVGGLFVYFPKTQSHEIGRQRSPDGIGDAILMEFPADAAGSHGYKVCMQRPSGIKFVPNNCREVTYLGGVSTESRSQSVTLIWTTPTELEIRYVSATSVHIYQPIFTWGFSRYAPRVGSIRPIHVQAVQAR
jgi:hypothetical protein